MEEIIKEKTIDMRGNVKTGVVALVNKSAGTAHGLTEWTTQTGVSETHEWTACWWILPDVSVPAVFTQPGVTRASASQGAPPTIASQLSPRRRGSGGGPDRDWKPHKPSRAEQTGFTELLSSQAPIPRTTLVAHSLSQGLWAGKYGFMCAHITFGSREAFKSNYGECYLHELLF